jgi:hypothetical protein
MELATLVHKKLEQLRALSFLELAQAGDSYDEKILNTWSKKVSVSTFIEPQKSGGELLVIVVAYSSTFPHFWGKENFDGFRIAPDNQIRELEETDLDAI